MPPFNRPPARRGLLGQGFDDPQTQFNLSLAAGLLGSRGSLGQAIGQALPGAVGAQREAAQVAEGRQLRADEQARLQAIAQMIGSTPPGQSPDLAAIARAGGRPAELATIHSAFPAAKAPELKFVKEGINQETGRPELVGIFGNANVRPLGVEPKAKDPLVKIDNFEPANTTIQKESMQSLIKNADTLANAPAALANIEKAKALVSQSGGYVGQFANIKLTAVKALNNNLGTTIDPNEVASAEELRSRMFFQIMDNLKKLDATPSQEQQRIMQEALGSIGTDPQAIPRVLDAFADSIRQKVTEHNRRATQVMQNPNIRFPYDPRIEVPEPTPTRREIPRNPDGTFADPRMEELYRKLDREGKLD